MWNDCWSESTKENELERQEMVGRKQKSEIKMSES